MSDIYLPELMELDSYWQKAVEDAISDTLKGEQRLHIALRNRKKINQKFQDLGLKCVSKEPALGSSVLPAFSETDSEVPDVSTADESQEIIGPVKSTSEYNEGSIHKSPERPLLGDGSHEKIKKSQNSFNFEPMGEEYMSESEKDDTDYTVVSLKGSNDRRNKNIEWLHIRGDTDFRGSDAESEYNTQEDEELDEDGGDENDDDDDEENDEKENGEDGEDGEEESDYQMLVREDFNFEDDENTDLTEAMSEGGSSNAITISQASTWENDGPLMRNSSVLDRKLHLALAKRDILNHTLNASNFGTGSAFIEIPKSAAKVAEKRKNMRNSLSPFIQFYLEVYRELCHKSPVKQITEEAAKRWRNMSAKEKLKYSKSKQRK